MSLRAYSAVWDHFEGTSAQRLVMLALADHADEHGIAWPSWRELSEKTGLSRRQVAGHLQRIKQSGQLEVLDNQGGGAPGTTPLYFITLPGLDGDPAEATQRRRRGTRRVLKPAPEPLLGRNR